MKGKWAEYFSAAHALKKGYEVAMTTGGHVDLVLLPELADGILHILLVQLGLLPLVLRREPQGLPEAPPLIILYKGRRLAGALSRQ